MGDSIAVAIITGVVSALTSIVAIIISNEKNNALQDERIKFLREQMQKLTEKVEQHNNFGVELTELKTRVNILENRLK